MTINKDKVTLAAWTTADELKFIAGIVKQGTLAGYVVSILKRSEWGAIDLVVVDEAARRRLAWLRSRASA